MNVWNSSAITVSHSHFRMKREKEPFRISYRMVTRLDSRKKLRSAVKLCIKKCVPKSYAMDYVVWMSSSSFL